MVIDTLKNAEQYYIFGERYKTAFEWLKNNDITKMKEGRYDIDGDDVFALVQYYDTTDIEDCWCETHVLYVDLHYVAEGFENFGYKPIERAGAPTRGYGDEEDDILYRRDGQFVFMQEGDFTLCFPHDAHMPRKRANLPSKVWKACIKIRYKD